MLVRVQNIVIIISVEAAKYYVYNIVVSSVAKYTLGGTFVLFLIPPFRHRFDDKIWRHVRNWNANDHWDRFRTQE